MELFHSLLVASLSVLAPEAGQVDSAREEPWLEWSLALRGDLVRERK